MKVNGQLQEIGWDLLYMQYTSKEVGVHCSSYQCRQVSERVTFKFDSIANPLKRLTGTNWRDFSGEYSKNAYLNTYIRT